MFTRNCQLTRPISSVRTALPSSLLALAVLATACAPTPKSGLHLQDAYIKTAIPGRSMTAAYATLTNHEPARLCLVDYRADFATTVELHITERAGGPNSQQVRMRRIAELCLEPGESVELAPGGRHLMVMGLTDMPVDKAAIALGSSSGRLFQATFQVQPFNLPFPSSPESRPE